MFDNFADYMYYLLTTPFKRIQKSLNQWYIFCTVIGKWFDECEEDLYRARSETMAATCSNEMLRIHGEDRKLTRYNNEKFENFRTRICMYEEICQLGGTNQGILLAAKVLGYTAPKVVTAWELYNDPARWAEFYLLNDLDIDIPHPISYEILRKVVREVKEVGAKDNYMFHYTSLSTVLWRTSSSAMFISQFYPRHNDRLMLLDGDWTLDGSYDLSGWKDSPPDLFFDGTWTLDGSENLTGYRGVFPDHYPMIFSTESQAKIEPNYEMLLVVEKDLWYLDGSVLLDGSRSMGADIIIYEM